MEANALSRVLLVEDDRLVAETFLDFLEGQPVAAEHVNTGAAAMTRLDTAPPDGSGIQGPGVIRASGAVRGPALMA
jgi:CheY-like chemotaxis protein